MKNFHSNNKKQQQQTPQKWKRQLYLHNYYTPPIDHNNKVKLLKWTQIPKHFKKLQHKKKTNYI